MPHSQLFNPLTREEILCFLGSETESLGLDEDFFTDRNICFQGWSLRDNGNSGNALPVVLVLHAVNGPERNEFLHAWRLAQAGYIAYVPNIFDPGDARGKGFFGQIARICRYTLNKSLLERRLAAALGQARSLPNVNFEKANVAGFCFGGYGAIQLANWGADLRCAIAFHPGLSRPLYPGNPGQVKAQLLIFHGLADRCIGPPRHVRKMQRWWKTQHPARLEAKGYPNAQHGFTDDMNSKPSPWQRFMAIKYDAAAAADSWQRALMFLGKYN